MTTKNIDAREARLIEIVVANRQYLDMVLTEYTTDEISGTMGRAVVRDALKWVEDAEYELAEYRNEGDNVSDEDYRGF